jgi:dockerin type I repeat protein
MLPEMAAALRFWFPEGPDPSKSAYGNGEFGMLSASSFVRKAAALIICALAARVAPAVTPDTINLSLNVFYSTPTNTSSGGNWELVAKSCQAGPCGNFGIAGITTRIRNINSGAIDEGPRGIVNGSNPAGFGLFVDTPHVANPPVPAFHEIAVGQLPIAPLPAGNEQSLFYGVGTIANGSPGTIGPAFTSLTSPQDIPWAATPDPFGDAAWNIGARLASGTFSTGVTPAFLSGSVGNVFTAVGTSTTIGNIDQAGTVTTIVRTNFQPSADYNHNGIVDAADYVIWRKLQGQPAVPPGAGADGNGDGFINNLDYDLWRAHFGNPFGAGAGGGLSTNSVPEPASCMLVAFGALLIGALCRPRRRGLVNN